MQKRMTHINEMLPFGEPLDWKELDLRERVLVIDEQWAIHRWKDRLRRKALVGNYTVDWA